MEYSDKNRNSNSNLMFNRSYTINRSSEIAKTPLYDLYTPPTFHRNGSVKNISFGSMVSAGISLKGKVKKLCSIFESPKHPSNSPNSQSQTLSSPSSTKPTKLLLPADSNSCPDYIPRPVPFRLPGTEDRVVVYFTSLRGIRTTFQECFSIRMIFKGFRINLDERDISMDAAYRTELQRVLGENSVSLPQVFIKGKYIGGADVVKQLLEAGELARLLKGLPMRALKPCDACDDVRFIPCMDCNGSRKVFDEDEDQLKRCPECNENGLARCPLCCS